jgi:hypothetical protein
MPAAAATKNQPLEPRFKIDPAASPMPETSQPERLAPGRHQIGMVGEIISESAPLSRACPFSEDF